MKYVVKKLPPAEWDLFEAALWYDEQGENLADRFLSEVDAAVRSLEVQPQIYGVRFADVRCVRLKRFHAYGVYYLMRPAEVWIIAIFHASRDPNELAARRTQFGS
jgi:plasmid stabilization system protein ParE